MGHQHALWSWPCGSLGTLSTERATRPSESCSGKTINDGLGAQLISTAVLKALLALKETPPLQLIKDLVELVFLGSSFFSDCMGSERESLFIRTERAIFWLSHLYSQCLPLFAY